MANILRKKISKYGGKNRLLKKRSRKLNNRRIAKKINNIGGKPNKKRTKRTNKRKPRKISKIKRGGVVTGKVIPFVPFNNPDDPVEGTGLTAFQQEQTPQESQPLTSLGEIVDDYEPLRQQIQSEEQADIEYIQGLFDDTPEVVVEDAPEDEITGELPELDDKDISLDVTLGELPEELSEGKNVDLPDIDESEYVMVGKERTCDIGDIERDVSLDNCKKNCSVRLNKKEKGLFGFGTRNNVRDFHLTDEGISYGNQVIPWVKKGEQYIINATPVYIDAGQSPVGIDIETTDKTHNLNIKGKCDRDLCTNDRNDIQNFVDCISNKIIQIAILRLQDEAQPRQLKREEVVEEDITDEELEELEESSQSGEPKTTMSQLEAEVEVENDPFAQLDIQVDEEDVLSSQEEKEIERELEEMSDDESDDESDVVSITDEIVPVSPVSPAKSVRAVVEEEEPVELVEEEPVELSDIESISSDVSVIDDDEAEKQRLIELILKLQQV